MAESDTDPPEQVLRETQRQRSHPRRQKSTKTRGLAALTVHQPQVAASRPQTDRRGVQTRNDVVVAHRLARWSGPGVRGDAKSWVPKNTKHHPSQWSSGKTAEHAAERETKPHAECPGPEESGTFSETWKEPLQDGWNCAAGFQRRTRHKARRAPIVRHGWCGSQPDG